MTTLTFVRAGLVALTIVALGFVPGVSVANPPSATGNGDFLQGGDLRTFSFSAIQQPNGNVAGQTQVNSRASGAIVSMDINCLNFVSPNTVFVSGTITNSNIPSLVGQTGTFEAVDNGKGTKSSPDRLSLVVVSANCNSPLTLELFDIQHGNIQVQP